jgi:CubicO group peptidase (beta-lactamase class C family)
LVIFAYSVDEIMNFTKPKIYFKITAIALILMSCQKNPNANSGDNSEVEDTLGKLKPSKLAFENLSESYLSSKKASVQHFFNKNWSASRNISLLVAKDGQIIFEKYQGFANKNKKTDINEETPLHIASVSKVLTATAVLELINKGKIKLNQKVNTILKTFPYPNITIKTLLNHRSGLRNYAYFTEEPGVWDRKKILTNEDLLRILGEKNIQLEFLTDKRFAYCNTNYAMLALVIEKITGLKYPEAMKEMIFEPLGMVHSFVMDYDKDRKNVAPSYKGNNVEIGMDYLDCIYGDKNIYSTPRDLMKFDLARNAPTFLNTDLKNEIYKGYSNEHNGTKNYGLGIRMIDWETGQHFYFHNGWWHGNTSSYITLQKENVVIIALSNQFTTLTYKVRDLAPLFGDYPFKIEKGELGE